MYQIASSIDSIEDFNDEPALNIIGLLVDSSGDLGREDGLNHAIDLAEELINRDLKNGHQSRIHYDLGNAYSNLRQIKATDSGRWWWENEILQREIYHFRMALDPEDLTGISKREVCKIYTNLGNCTL